LPGSVLDSYALVAFLFGERGSEKVVTRLERALGEDRPVLVSAPNWAEVRYVVERRAGATRWPDTRQTLRALPISIVAADESLAEAAGALKASKRMSLADCFAAALAMASDADVYTGDPEFKEVEKQVRIVWL
jgi:PIN domain nuclease of toxin-antitoxin system